MAKGCHVTVSTHHLQMSTAAAAVTTTTTIEGITNAGATTRVRAFSTAYRALPRIGRGSAQSLGMAASDTGALITGSGDAP